MRISDWSSDVCSSDLPGRHPPIGVGQVHVDSREQGPAIAKEGEPAVRLVLVLQYADPAEAAHLRCSIVEVEVDALVQTWMLVRLAVAFVVQCDVALDLTIPPYKSRCDTALFRQQPFK